MNREMMEDRKLKLLAPIGELPSQNTEVMAIVENGKDMSISKIISEIDNWQKIAVRKYKEFERTDKSYKLDGNCW